MTTDHRVAKWERWMNGPVRASVYDMHLHRDTWQQVAAMLDAHEGLPDSYWWEFMTVTYATTQTMAVRRQVDMHKDVASLRKVLREMQNDPRNLTRVRWLGLWEPFQDDFHRRYAEQAWTTQWGGSVGAYLDPAIPEGDIARLDEAAKKVAAYTDRHVAHQDAVSVEVTLTLDDVHEAVEVIGNIYARYSNLIDAGSHTTLVPVMQEGPPTLDVFKIAWWSRRYVPADGGRVRTTASVGPGATA